MKKREIDLWHLKVRAFCKVPKAPLQTAKLTLTRFSSQEPDGDNVLNAFKPLIDALICQGVLADDKLSNIGIPKIKWFKAKPKEGKVSVKIEETSDKWSHELGEWVK